LVTKSNLIDIEEKVSRLNPQAKILKSIQSKINVMDILNTSLFKDKEDFWVTSTKNAIDKEGLAASTENGKRVPESCTARFDIKSFVYRARKPFHPGRLNDLFLKPFFADPVERVEVVEEPEDFEELPERKRRKIEDEKKKIEEKNKKEIEKLQKQVVKKQNVREEKIGQLLRSKGFVWIATSHDIMGGWQQAGNVLRIKAEGPWMCCFDYKQVDYMSEEAILADMKKPDGEFYEFKDRRQEIVFIGHKMKSDVIQELLDQCLLTEEEMPLGPEKWWDSMHKRDNIQLFLEIDDHADDEDETDVKTVTVGVDPTEGGNRGVGYINLPTEGKEKTRKRKSS